MSLKLNGDKNFINDTVKNETFNYSFKIYLILLFVLCVFYLIQKHENLTEWTISEWLINYQGGFTRRGFLGEIIYQINLITNIPLRKIILFFQIFIYFCFYIHLYIFLKKINKNIILIFAIFSPLFLIYPVAEVEVLARKEIFLFYSFLLFINILSGNNKLIYYLYSSIIISICILIWEGSVFFIPFYIFLVIAKNKFIIDQKLIKPTIVSIILPLLVLVFVIFFRLSPLALTTMCDSIGECYGAMTYLNNNLSSNISEVTSGFKPSYLIRYILIFFIGFFPLIVLLKNSKANSSISKKPVKKIINLFFIVSFLPSMAIFIIAKDWGRWLNIQYTLGLLAYLYCLKNNLISTEITKAKIYCLPKKIIIIFFIIFAFGWN